MKLLFMVSFEKKKMKIFYNIIGGINVSCGPDDRSFLCLCKHQIGVMRLVRFIQVNFG